MPAPSRPRPLRANEPGWTVIDLTMDDDEWAACIAAARYKKIPVAVWIRNAIRTGMEYERIMGSW